MNNQEKSLIILKNMGFDFIYIFSQFVTCYKRINNKRREFYCFYKFNNGNLIIVTNGQEYYIVGGKIIDGNGLDFN